MARWSRCCFLSSLGLEPNVFHSDSNGGPAGCGRMAHGRRTWVRAYGARTLIDEAQGEFKGPDRKEKTTTLEQPAEWAAQLEEETTIICHHVQWNGTVKGLLLDAAFCCSVSFVLADDVDYCGVR